MGTSFQLCHTDLSIESDDANSENEIVGTPCKMSVAHRVCYNDVHRTLVEFGRCFLFVSVAVGSS